MRPNNQIQIKTLTQLPLAEKEEQLKPQLKPQPVGRTAKRVAGQRKCVVDGCVGTDRLCRGMCQTHYKEWRLNFTPVCTAKDCLNPSVSKGLCDKHRVRSYRYGSPDTLKRKGSSWRVKNDPTGENRIKEFQIKNDGCWKWTGPKNNAGYPRLTIQGQDVPIHRLMFSLHKGPIPKGMCICHACDNPECTNPDHLWLGTYRDNVQDCIQKGRARYRSSKVLFQEPE